MDNYYKKQFSFENIRRTMDDINEATYGVRPYGTKREINLEATVQELSLSELLGMPVKIKKDA